MKRSGSSDFGLAFLAAGTFVASALAASGASFAGSRPGMQRSSIAAPKSSGSASSTPTVSTVSTPQASSIAPPLTALPSGSSSDLVVLGDATSNQTGEWVNELGAQLGSSRLVRVQRVNQDTFTAYNSPISYGSADPSLRVWNASVDDPPPLDETAVGNLVPKGTDLVVISHGRGASASSITSDLDETLASLRATYPKVPVAVVLQPDDGSSQPAIAAVRAWATTNGLPTIDVAKAFAKSGRQLQDAAGELTGFGTTLWASTVAKAIS